MHHVGELRQVAYCPRQKYYSEQDPDSSGADAVYRGVVELAYRYPELLSDPDEAVETAAELSDVSPDSLLEYVDVSDAVESLRGLRDGDPETWRMVTEPERQELYVEARRIHGTVDKVVEGDDGLRGSLVKAGSPPSRGVWPSHRVEAAGVHRLLSTRHEVSRHLLIEYPKTGVVRTIRVRDSDLTAVDEAIDRLSSIQQGEEPRRTRHRGRCRSCGYRERCGVDSPLVALKQLGGMPDASDGGFGERLTERFSGLFD